MEYLEVLRVTLSPSERRTMLRRWAIAVASGGLLVIAGYIFAGAALFGRVYAPAVGVLAFAFTVAACLIWYRSDPAYARRQSDDASD